MRIVSLLVLAACAKSGSPPANEGKPVPKPGNSTVLVTDTALPSGPEGMCMVGGTTIEMPTGAPIPGVTLIVTTGEATETTISNDDGAFSLALPKAPDKVTAYYADLTAEGAYTTAWCGKALRVEIVVTTH